MTSRRIDRFADRKADKLSPFDATALVESYRVKLGLRPWSELGNGRRSGRTTHTILCALARANMFPNERVILSADSVFVDHARGMLQGIANRLGLNVLSVEVVSHAKAADRDRWRGHNNVRFFADHFDAQRERFLESRRYARNGGRT